MADTGRQSLTDKAGAAIKPDSQKTLAEQAADTAKSLADSAASVVQPQGEKSTSQKVGDSVSSNNSNESTESYIDQAKGALGLGK